MAKAKFTEASILRQLDEHAAAFSFPVLDNLYIALGDVRLSAYRDPSRWAILIEVLGYFNRVGPLVGIETTIYQYGTGIRGRPGIGPSLNAITWERTPEQEDDEDGMIDVPPDLTHISIRGVLVDVPRDPKLYRARGIKGIVPDELTSDELLRVLLPEHRLALLATEDELGACLRGELTLVGRLDEWHHPDVANEDAPSHTQTFRELARLLVHGNPNDFRLTERPNTHWKHWPQGGTG